MHARIRTLFFVGSVLAIAALMSHAQDADASIYSRFMIYRKDIQQARSIAKDLRSLQEFSFADGLKVAHCRVNSLTFGEGFACDFHFGSKILNLTSLEMDRIDEKLATYAVGDRIFLRGRTQLECSVTQTKELEWACRF